VEAGHRCAIPACRHIEVDVAHIVPYEKCKEHKYENLIALCPNCHRRADKGEIDRKSLRMYKANLRYTHDKFSMFEVDFLFELYGNPPNYGTLFAKSMRLLIKRLIDAGYVKVHKDKRPTYNSLEKFLIPDTVIITEKGREFIDSLGLEHDW
jgi:hypothetical protein